MKKIFCLFAFSTLFLSSCSTDSSSNPTPTEPLVKSMVIDIANPADDDFNLLFTYSGNKLLNVKDYGVVVDEYIYTGEKLTRINFPQDDTYILIEYTGDQVSKFTEYDPDFDSATKTLVTYSGNTFTRTVYDGDMTTQTTLIFTEVCTVQNGNVTQSSRTAFGSTSTVTYTYDTKNNPFKNITSFTTFQVLDLDIEGNANNDTAINYPGNPYTISLTYNAEDYPLTELSYDGSAVLKESVSYTYY
jgi:hypothetical protein